MSLGAASEDAMASLSQEPNVLTGENDTLDDGNIGLSGRPVHPGGNLRWLILALACCGMVGSYYCYDIPSALNNELSAYLHLDKVHFNLLYTVYSIPNTILPLAGGLLTDRLGCNRCLVLFVSLIVLGQLLFSLGVASQSYALVLLGRTVFGFGGESLSVANSTLLAIWFQNREMALAMGLNLTVSRLGSVANNNASAAIYRATGTVVSACWLGCAITLLSLFAILGMVLIDYMMKRKRAEPQKKPGEDSPISVGVNIFDVLQFGSLFWLICASCIVVYSTILPFNNIAESFFEERYNISMQKADAYLSIPYTVSAIASPFLGGFVDVLGLRAVLLTLSAAALALAHGLYALTMVTPVLPQLIIGTAYSLYASAMWPSVAMVVSPSKLGTAYGVATAIQNAGLALVPLVVGAISDYSGSYEAAEVFFTAVAIAGVCIGIIINVVDKRSGSRLNKTEAAYFDDEESDEEDFADSQSNDLRQSLLPRVREVSDIA